MYRTPGCSGGWSEKQILPAKSPQLYRIQDYNGPDGISLVFDPCPHTIILAIPDAKVINRNFMPNLADLEPYIH